MQIAIQMDPLERLHQESDSSLVLANEAQNRGHKIFMYQPNQLSLKDHQVFALLCSLKIIKKKIDFKKVEFVILDWLTLLKIKRKGDIY